MRLLARRARVVLAMIAAFAALAAWQGAAAGALTVTSATVDGVTSTSTPPGGVFSARVTADVTQPDTWRATRARIGADSNCVNHDNKGQGRQSVSFNVTAPGTPGAYDAGFTAAGADNCGGTQSPEKVLQDAVRVTTPGPNPNLAPRCGIDVMLVLDESGSINSSGATEKVRDAARAFLGALSGTGAAVSIVDFSTTAGRPVGYTTVTADSIAAVFEPYLKNGYKPNGWTNWEAAFQKVREANDQGPLADLVVFVTDGDPTARNNPPGQPVTGLVDGDAEALRRAAAQADLVKGQGSHVFALGVGAAVTKPASARRLTAVSGFDRYPDTDFGDADYTLVQDFDDLAQALRQIAAELCEASVTVTKLVDEGDGTYRPDPGWTFTATVATTPGGYTWVRPAPPPATGPRSQTTDKDGIATFQWKTGNASAISTITIDEDLKPGYEFVDAVCTLSEPGVSRRRVIRDRTLGGTTGTLRPGEYARCTVRNKIIPGTIEIEKEATPMSPQAFAFAGSLGNFSLVDDGKQGPSSRTFAGLAPGTYIVSESSPAGWTVSGVSCSDQTVAIAGGQVSITLTAGASVVCTYRNQRDDVPTPPDPPTPPNPPNPPTQPVIPPVAAQLEVVKSAPRVARVGDRVAFEITVTNTSTVTADKVQLADVPPAALTLSSFSASSRPRLVRGNALWRFGTLAPGASRTVTGRVRIEAGTPGLKRNIVLATALNAQLVHNEADTRVLAQRRIIPPVTG